MALDEYTEGRVALLIRVTPEMHRRIKLAARSRGQSMSDLVQRAIRRDLGVQRVGPSIASQLRKGG